MELSRSPVFFAASLGGVTYQLRTYMKGIKEEKRLYQRHHQHFFIEFHYIYEGEEHIRLPREGRDIVLRAGELGIVPQGVYHGVKNDEPMTRFCFHLGVEYDDSKAEAVCAEQYRVHRLMKSIRRFLTIRDKAIGRMMGVFRAWEDPSGGAISSRRGALLLAVLFEIFRQLEESEQLLPLAEPQEKDSVALRQKWLMEEYFVDHFADGEGLAGLAGRLYLSERRTRTLVKEYFGRDYKEIVVAQRMELAEILLRDSELPLEEIAAEVGYRSYSGFYLAYLRYWGRAPGEARQENK